MVLNTSADVYELQYKTDYHFSDERYIDKLCYDRMILNFLRLFEPCFGIHGN